jgi:putative ABC transport system permease protein
METLLQDLRYSMRMLAKKPTFTLVATLTLAIGIGANTAIFSLVNTVLIRQLPFENSEKLVWIWSTRVDRDKAFFSIPNFIDFRDRTQTLEQIAAFANWGASLTGTDEPERMQGVRVSANAFQMLGVTAALGRTLLPEDDKPASERVVVMSYGLWERRFGLDRNIIGNKLTLNNDSYTVIGVLPRTFIFPGTEAEAEIAIPLSFETDPRRSERGSNFLRVFARVKPEAALKQTEAEFAGISNDLKQRYPDSNGKHAAPRVVALQDEMVGSYRSALLILLAAVGFVLLIACSNLANLLLASASARHKEIAVRTAIGATRFRLIRQLLTESVLLALAGGALGVFGAWWGIDLLLTLSPSDLPRSGEIGIDARVLVFTLVVSLLAGLIFGVTPAIQASKVDLIKELKGASKGSLDGFGRNRTRSILVISEIAISLVLLIGAGLLVKSFQRLQDVSPGFDADDLLLVRLSLPQASDSPRGSTGSRIGRRGKRPPDEWIECARGFHSSRPATDVSN